MVRKIKEMEQLQSDLEDELAATQEILMKVIKEREEEDGKNN